MNQPIRLTTDSILAALAVNDGDVERAADDLNINVRRLRIIMGERGIKP